MTEMTYRNFVRSLKKAYDRKKPSGQEKWMLMGKCNVKFWWNGSIQIKKMGRRLTILSSL